MIQRVQTLYLAIASLCMILMLALPGAVYTSTSDNKEVLYYSDLQKLYQGTEGPVAATLWPVVVCALLGIALPLISIFLFRDRRKQLLLCRLSFLILTLNAGLNFFYVEQIVNNLSGGIPFSTTYLAGSYMPFPAIFMVYLAIAAIRKDDELVRSADRLR